MVMTNYKEFNGITEFKNVLNSNDIKIWIYTLPVKDLNTKHNENYEVVKSLKKFNKNNHIIVFNEYIVGSFKEIDNWGTYKYINSEFRTINTKILTEVKILERLLLEEIKNSIDKSLYTIERNTNFIYVKEPLVNNNNLIMKRKIGFDINIEKDGSIIIGFTLSHGFEYIDTLEKDLQLNKISSGDKVKDFYTNSTYKFKQIAPFTIGEKNEYMKNSIIDYYNDRGQSYIVSQLNINTKAVLVETDKGDIFPYIPNRLKKVCDFGNLPGNIIKQCNKYMKLKSHDRMKISVDTTLDILKNSKYVEFKKENMLIENLGYKKHTVSNPKFVFGNGKVHSSIFYGLPQNGSYEKKEIEISYFIDPDIHNNHDKGEIIKKITKELEQFSARIGVNIKRKSTNLNFKCIRVENKDIFECDIRDIVEKYKNPSIVIMESYNAEKYYSSIKKIFGNKNNIPTQFIEFKTLNCNEQNKDAVFLNILLGVYGKSGIQPWILEQSLNADCYIGLDVSRENKLNTAGVIQIVGKDGKILRSKSITSSQRGEKIDIETIQEIFYEANSSYKKTYGYPLKHIVFHRDGISREELDILKDTANNLDIKFDYVEVTKNVKRRIATINNNDKMWETQMGTYYKKDNKAYIVTTSPFANLGMAQPIRIKKVYGEQSIDNIVDDVYKLSFMHIGSILKPRLPVTTHYADLSSTYGNREWMPRNIDNNILHFI